MSNILIFGNDKNLKNIDQEDIPDGFITIGTNRSFLKLKTDYLFFNDIQILHELINTGFDFTKTKVICSDWIYQTDESHRNETLIKKYIGDGYIQLYSRIDKNKYPDAVSTAIEIFNKFIFTGNENTYYISCASLIYDEKCNHFFTDTNSVLSNRGHEWYAPRFERTFLNFLKLSESNFKIVSITPNSKLNSIIKYIDPDTIFKRKTLSINVDEPNVSIIQSIKNVILPTSNKLNAPYTMASLKQFKEYIKDKSIAIVANSSDLLKHENGELIDSHDIVIRLNSYALNKIHTGVKTDIHCSIWLQTYNLDQNVDYRIIFSGAKANWNRFLDTEIIPGAQKYILDLHWPISNNIINANEHPGRCPTTGFNIIRTLIHLGGYKCISLFNFTFYENWEKSIYRNTETSNDKFPISKMHSYDYEKKWIIKNAKDILFEKNVIQL